MTHGERTARHLGKRSGSARSGVAAVGLGLGLGLGACGHASSPKVGSSASSASSASAGSVTASSSGGGSGSASSGAGGDSTTTTSSSGGGGSSGTTASSSSASTNSTSSGAPDAGAVAPYGAIPGTWTLAFDDEFEGSTLDATKWTTMSGGGWGSTTCAAANVAVSGGNLVLTLASKSSGGCVCTGDACAPAFGGYFPAGSGAYTLPVGGYTEARINFPGSGMSAYNWPAWWTSGPSWPKGGENDIAEGLGKLTITYHSPTGAHPGGAPAGTWPNAFHVYGLHRMATSADVYYDGQKVGSYATDDDGARESLIFDLMDGYGQAVYGSGSQVLVDYVRAWE